MCDYSLSQFYRILPNMRMKFLYPFVKLFRDVNTRLTYKHCNSFGSRNRSVKYFRINITVVKRY